ncbi:nitrilase-like protein [Sphaerosporella brunnea]|uniref:Nitrilase-like protein n=1 Tax=Sphaerosporella brunnea TaxID=1250544 RepID=A0A5J5EV60_9PEZI|nr:nitrilase-like protein [Sphaerosporella brunnea]
MSRPDSAAAVRIACGQFCATPNPAANLASCTKLAQLAAAGGARALFLPEASDYISRSAGETLSLCQPAASSEFVLGLRALAQQHGMAIIAGIHTPPASASASSSGRVRNTCVYISEEGAVAAAYDKVHLFDIDLPACGICFDLRFPEPARWLVARGAQLLCYPSAFTVPTGRAHWELLLRARAVEGQVWVVAPAQVGRHTEGRRSWGGACVVDPWGEVRGRCRAWDELDEEVCLVDVDLEVLRRVRRECPLRRREDVYPAI